MNNIQIINQQGDELNVELIFSFNCPDTQKNYVALDNKNNIFEPTSRYSNIDIFEITKIKGKNIYITDIPSSEWEIVKRALQFNVFAKMN